MEVYIVNSTSHDVGENQVFNKLFESSCSADECFRRLVKEEDKDLTNEDIEEHLDDGYYDGDYSYIQVSSEQVQAKALLDS